MGRQPLPHRRPNSCPEMTHVWAHRGQGMISLSNREEMQMNTTRIWPSSPVTLTKIKTLIRPKAGWDVGKSLLYTHALLVGEKSL